MLTNKYCIFFSDIVMTEETEIETFDGKISFERKSGSRCLTEKGLDLYGGTFVMAPTETFTRESFGQCLHFCMTHAPDQSHLLISYYNALLIGDKVSTYLKSIHFLNSVFSVYENKVLQM